MPFKWEKLFFSNPILSSDIFQYLPILKNYDFDAENFKIKVEKTILGINIV